MSLSLGARAEQRVLGASDARTPGKLPVPSCTQVITCVMPSCGFTRCCACSGSLARASMQKSWSRGPWTELVSLEAGSGNRGTDSVEFELPAETGPKKLSFGLDLLPMLTAFPGRFILEEALIVKENEWHL